MPQAADQRALGLLRGIRFEPVKETSAAAHGDAGRLEWGEAIFYWQTVQPPKPPRGTCPGRPFIVMQPGTIIFLCFALVAGVLAVLVTMYEFR